MLTQAHNQVPASIKLHADGARRAVATLGPLGSIESIGIQMTYGPNEEIFGENESADYVYKVVSGAVRTYQILNDGRRQIGAFYLPGDTFGLEVGKHHHLSAEAVNDTMVLMVRRTTIMARAERDCDAAHELWAFTARELAHAQKHMLLLVKSAPQRVASFLLEMSERLEAAESLDLPMSRQDIADYLGLTIETVSRTMSQLVSEAAIGLPSSRHIVLRNRGALRRLNA